MSDEPSEHPIDLTRSMRSHKNSGNYEKLSFIPTNEYGHKDSLIRTEMDKIDKLEKLITKSLSLGNIHDDAVIQLTNERMGLCVIPLFQVVWRLDAQGKKFEDEAMAIRDIAEWLFGRVEVDLRTTRSKDGFENFLQHDAVNRGMKDQIEKSGGFGIPNRKKQGVGEMLSGNEIDYE